MSSTVFYPNLSSTTVEDKPMDLSSSMTMTSMGYEKKKDQHITPPSSTHLSEFREKKRKIPKRLLRHHWPNEEQYENSEGGVGNLLAEDSLLDKLLTPSESCSSSYISSSDLSQFGSSTPISTRQDGIKFTKLKEYVDVMNTDEKLHATENKNDTTNDTTISELNSSNEGRRETKKRRLDALLSRKFFSTSSCSSSVDSASPPNSTSPTSQQSSTSPLSSSNGDSAVENAVHNHSSNKRRKQSKPNESVDVQVDDTPRSTFHVQDTFHDEQNSCRGAAGNLEYRQRGEVNDKENEQQSDSTNNFGSALTALLARSLLATNSSQSSQSSNNVGDNNNFMLNFATVLYSNMLQQMQLNNSNIDGFHSANTQHSGREEDKTVPTLEECEADSSGQFDTPLQQERRVKNQIDPKTGKRKYRKRAKATEEVIKETDEAKSFTNVLAKLTSPLPPPTCDILVDQQPERPCSGPGPGLLMTVPAFKRHFNNISNIPCNYIPPAPPQQLQQQPKKSSCKNQTNNKYLKNGSGASKHVLKLLRQKILSRMEMKNRKQSKNNEMLSITENDYKNAADNLNSIRNRNADGVVGEMTVQDVSKTSEISNQNPDTVTTLIKERIEAARLNWLNMLKVPFLQS